MVPRKDGFLVSGILLVTGRGDLLVTRRGLFTRKKGIQVALVTAARNPGVVQLILVARNAMIVWSGVRTWRTSRSMPVAVTTVRVVSGTRVRYPHGNMLAKLCLHWLIGVRS